MGVKSKWLLVVEGDVEPFVYGPYADEDKRVNGAKRWRKREGDTDTLLRIDVENGRPTVSAFTSGELETVKGKATSTAKPTLTPTLVSKSVPVSEVRRKDSFLARDHVTVDEG
jgi:hypothetical protein